jgi:hypothetical protein
MPAITSTHMPVSERMQARPHHGISKSSPELRNCDRPRIYFTSSMAATPARFASSL